MDVMPDVGCDMSKWAVDIALDEAFAVGMSPACFGDSACSWGNMAGSTKPSRSV
jgi:hypothetical protein